MGASCPRPGSIALLQQEVCKEHSQGCHKPLIFLPPHLHRNPGALASLLQQRGRCSVLSLSTGSQPSCLLKDLGRAGAPFLPWIINSPQLLDFSFQYLIAPSQPQLCLRLASISLLPATERNSLKGLSSLAVRASFPILLFTMKRVVFFYE